MSLNICAKKMVDFYCLHLGFRSPIDDGTFRAFPFSRVIFYRTYFMYSSITLSSVGLAFLGCSCSIIFVPLLPEIIDGVREKEGIRDLGTINDKAAGFFNTAYAVGCIIAPIIGGYLSMLTDFRKTCDIMAISSASYAVIFFVVIILPAMCCNQNTTVEEIVIPAEYQQIEESSNNKINISSNAPGRNSLMSNGRPTFTGLRSSSEYQSRGTMSKSAYKVNYTDLMPPTILETHS